MYTNVSFVYFAFIKSSKCGGILVNGTSRTSIFTKLPISSDCCKGYGPETSVTFLLLGTGMFLVLFYIYPIVPYTLALCAQFLLFINAFEKCCVYRMYRPVDPFGQSVHCRNHREQNLHCASSIRFQPRNKN